MPTDVLMPQMGESISEGTVTRWLKKVGDAVNKDEPLFEISTDKVDAEIPSPVAGTLTKVLVQEGQTVVVHAVVAQIEAASAESVPSVPSAKADAVKAAAKDPQATAEPAAAQKPESQKLEAKIPEKVEAEPEEEAATVRSSPTKAVAAKASAKAPEATAEPVTAAKKSEAQKLEAPKPESKIPEKVEAEPEEEAATVRSSPLVRRMASEHNVDLTQVQGTGAGGRVTKEDLLAYLEQSKTAEAPPAEMGGPAEEVPTRMEVVPMSAMRKKIAERMVFSRHTAAHVTTVFAVDFSPVLALYQREKDRFERDTSTRLTLTPFFVRAVMDALKRFPILNSSVEGDNIVYKKDIHMGIAVALEWGLIVPVVHHADEMNFLGLTRAINDVAERARSKKLAVSDVQGGTFTVTNPGVYGSLYSTPIINPPQVGIVGVHTINKMPVVIDDAIAIRSIVHLSLSYDHRVVDGAVADQFMAAAKKYLENWEESLL